jgi:hypothetical protein
MLRPDPVQRLVELGVVDIVGRKVIRRPRGARPGLVLRTRRVTRSMPPPPDRRYSANGERQQDPPPVHSSSVRQRAAYGIADPPIDARM